MILTLLCCGYALWRGGGPERLTALTVLLGSGFSVAAITAWPMRFHSTELAVATIDMLVLAAMVTLALRSNRFWPIGVAGVQLFGVIAHVLSLTSSAISPGVYALMMQIGIYPILLLLSIGTFNHGQRLKRRGEDRSWVTSSRRSIPPARMTGPIAS